jgi:phosphomannomutase
MATDPRVPSGIFRAAGVLGHVPNEVNEYVMRKVGLAAAQYLRAESPAGSRFAVASDPRESSRGLARIFCEGVNRGGLDTAYVGCVPPELLAFVLGTDGCTGAALISGGTYGVDVNGVQLWGADGSVVGFGTGLEKIGLIARRLRTGCSRTPGEMVASNPITDYIAYVRKFAPRLEPMKVVVDTGGGSAGPLLNAVFAGLPVEIVPCHFEQNARSPVLGKKFPTRAVCTSVRSKVQETRADFGAAIDYPGQRIVFFDQRGEEMRCDVAAGLIATELLSRTPGACVAYDLRSTAALRARIAGHGGEPVAAPTSRVAFVQQFRRSDAIYGADMTGLHYFKDFFRFPSPTIALLLMCSYLGQDDAPVGERAADLRRLTRGGEVVIETPSAEVAAEVLGRVRDEFQDADRDLIDGLTVRLQDWWFNLRQPHEAAELRLNVEARNRRELRKGQQTIERMVSRLLSEI